MVANSKIKDASIEPPASRDEAGKAMQQIGQLQSKVKILEAELTDEINEIRTRASRRVTPINEEIESLFQGLKMYFLVNKRSLLVGKARSLRIGPGVAGLRKNPVRCTLKGVEEIIKNLKAAGHDKAVRTKEEVNKEHIIEHREDYAEFPGITVKSSEDFFIKPDETELERAEVIK